MKKKILLVFPGASGAYHVDSENQNYSLKPEYLYLKRLAARKKYDIEIFVYLGQVGVDGQFKKYNDIDYISVEYTTEYLMQKVMKIIMDYSEIIFLSHCHGSMVMLNLLLEYNFSKFLKKIRRMIISSPMPPFWTIWRDKALIKENAKKMIYKITDIFNNIVPIEHLLHNLFLKYSELPHLFMIYQNEDKYYEGKYIEYLKSMMFMNSHRENVKFVKIKGNSHTIFDLKKSRKYIEIIFGEKYNLVPIQRTPQKNQQKSAAKKQNTRKFAARKRRTE